MDTYNPPVTIQVYLGSGREAQQLRANLIKAGGKSVSRLIVNLLKKADPKLFKGVKYETDEK